MKKAIGFYPCPDLDTAATTVVSYAGTRLLTETIGKVGLDRALSRVLEPWRPRLAVHDPAKVLLDLALALAVGGDCLADIALLRAEPALFGPVASDPTVSRTIDRLAADSAAVLAAIDTARAAARAQAWALAGDAAPDHDTDAARPLVIDVDATLVTAHSDKQGAAPTFKKGFGHHPLWAFVDHGPAGTGEPLAALLRPGNAGSQHRRRPHHRDPGCAAPAPRARPGNRAGRKVLIRVDGAGAIHELLDWLAQAAAVLFGRVRAHPSPGRPARRPAHRGLADRSRRRRRTPSRRLGHRSDRADEPEVLADRDASDRPQGAAAPGRAAAAHRPGRVALHRVRHQHPPRRPRPPARRP